MRTLSILAFGLLACGGPAKRAPAPAAATTTGSAESNVVAPERERKAGDAGTFEVKNADKSSRPNQGKLQPTATEAVVRLFVVDKDNNSPIEGIAISLTAPDGKKESHVELPHNAGQERVGSGATQACPPGHAHLFSTVALPLPSNNTRAQRSASRPLSSFARTMNDELTSLRGLPLSVSESTMLNTVHAHAVRLPPRRAISPPPAGTSRS
jgi:hypothetical protein